MNALNNINQALSAVAALVAACFVPRNFSGEIAAFKQLACEVLTQGISWERHLSDVGALEELRMELMQDYYDHIQLETQGRICPTIARLMKAMFLRDFNVHIEFPITCQDHDLGGHPSLEWWLDGVMPEEVAAPVPAGWEYVTA